MMMTPPTLILGGTARWLDKVHRKMFVNEEEVSMRCRRKSYNNDIYIKLILYIFITELTACTVGRGGAGSIRYIIK